MEPLQLKPRLPVEDEIENWDDDDFLVDGDDISFRSPSTATNANSRPPSRRRDSGSSHFSFRSELESHNGEEERHVHIPGDDEKSTLDAIAAAQSAGIPLPQNVPSSALMGGTIKRLGGRKIRKIIQEDWENDMEIPDFSQGLKIKMQDASKFPESLRQVSAGSSQTSPPKLIQSPALIMDDRRTSTQSTTSALSAAMNLDKFKDDDDMDDFFGDGGDTIKVSKTRQLPKPVSFITPPTPQRDVKPSAADDDFELDLELPSDGKLKLSMRKDIPKTPPTQLDDLDWGEGSLGTRYGGTRRDVRSNRSSAASAMSPSVSSSITAESEDETFDGLVLPPGPVDFLDRLKHRRNSRSPQRPISEEPISPPKKETGAEADKQDFLDGLDLGEGEVFDSGKLTLHKNVKVKETRPSSPVRPKAAVSLTFSNKPSSQPSSQTRIPRLNHERAHSSLEPVYESVGPIPRSRRSQSRLGHSAQSSVTSLPTPTTPSPSQAFPPTPRRRELVPRTSTSCLRAEPTTTSAQLLKQKRSLPAIRASHTPAKSSFRYERPPSRSDGNNRPLSGVRPKTPVERQRISNTESPATTRKGPMPFLPAGASQSQSQHVTSKNPRQFRRHDSENSIELRPHSRTVSRSTIRSPSPHRPRVADTWERLSKPKNKKQFGDGHELDGFDDLPTSKETENKYLKQPITSGPKAALRNKLYQNVLPERNTPSPSSPQTPSRNSYTPHFARDTAASRRARETSLAQRVPSSGPLAPLTSQRVAQLSTRSNLSPQSPVPGSTVRSRKHSKRPQQSKPHLITNLNSGKESKMVNGMYYNADTFRWEGNENALNVFDASVSTPIQASTSTFPREKDTPTPRPALITNISATKGVQVVGGMVFDPQNMCWLKLDGPSKSKSETSDTMDGFDALDEDEDVFKDIPDLEDITADDDGIQGRVSDVKDDWLVGEEFDVGPEFVRRQREEEDRWRKKCEKWIGRGTRDREAWRWTIRELVSQFDDLPM